MMTVHGYAGEHISKSAKRLCDAASAHGSARLIFNDIELVASTGDTPDKIERDFDAAMNAARVAYLNSPQKAIDDARRDAEIAEMQELHDNLMHDLKSLDWSSDVAVLDWLCAMQPASDHIGVACRNNDILATFAKHGFEPNVNIGDKFNGNDRDNYFRYVVGQALSTMQHCAIHHMIIVFAERWKNKFNIQAQ